MIKNIYDKFEDHSMTKGSVNLYQERKDTVGFNLAAMDHLKVGG